MSIIHSNPGIQYVCCTKKYTLFFFIHDNSQSCCVPFVSNAHMMYMVNVSGQAVENVLNSPSVTYSNKNTLNQTNVYKRKSITNSNSIVRILLLCHL